MPDFRDQLAALYDPVPPEGMLAALAAAGFDPAGYAESQPDLAGTGLTGEQLAAHFLLLAVAENRHGAFRPGAADPAPLLALPVANRGLLGALCAQVLLSIMDPGGTREVFLDTSPATVADALRSMQARPFVMAGDSHGNAYARPLVVDGVAWAPVPLRCSAGSAMGLGNPQSRSGYGPRLLRLLAGWQETPALRGVPLFLKFGQVDAEFVWVFRRIREGRQRHVLAAFEAFAAESVARYAGFLASLLESGVPAEALRVHAIFPPCLSDAAWAQGYVNAHVGALEGDRPMAELAAAVQALEIPSLFERTQMHALYNGLLQQACARLGLLFVNDFAPLVTGDGVVGADYARFHGGTDHHLNGQALLPLLGAILGRYGAVRKLGTPPF